MCALLGSCKADTTIPGRNPSRIPWNSGSVTPTIVNRVPSIRIVLPIASGRPRRRRVARTRPSERRPSYSPLGHQPVSASGPIRSSSQERPRTRRSGQGRRPVPPRREIRWSAAAWKPPQAPANTGSLPRSSRIVDGNPASIRTNRSASRTPEIGRRSSAFTKLKIAMLAPMPNAMDATAKTLVSHSRRKDRNPYRTSLVIRLMSTC